MVWSVTDVERRKRKRGNWWKLKPKTDVKLSLKEEEKRGTINLKVFQRWTREGNKCTVEKRGKREVQETKGKVAMIMATDKQVLDLFHRKKRKRRMLWKQQKTVYLSACEWVWEWVCVRRTNWEHETTETEAAATIPNCWWHGFHKLNRCSPVGRVSLPCVYVSECASTASLPLQQTLQLSFRQKVSEWVRE